MEKYKIDYIRRELEENLRKDLIQAQIKLSLIIGIQKAFLIWDTQKHNKAMKESTHLNKFAKLVESQVELAPGLSMHYVYVDRRNFFALRVTNPVGDYGCEYHENWIYADGLEEIRKKTTGEEGNKWREDIKKEVEKLKKYDPEKLSAKIVKKVEEMETFYKTFPYGKTRQFVKKEISQL